MPFDPVTYKAPVVDADGDILRRAAHIIEERGWCQFRMNVDGGPTCLVGAIEIALLERDGDYHSGIHPKKIELCRRMGFPELHSVAEAMCWSDRQPGGSHVAMRLRAAAVRS